MVRLSQLVKTEVITIKTKVDLLRGDLKSARRNKNILNNLDKAQIQSSLILSRSRKPFNAIICCSSSCFGHLGVCLRRIEP